MSTKTIVFRLKAEKMIGRTLTYSEILNLIHQVKPRKQTRNKGHSQGRAKYDELVQSAKAGDSIRALATVVKPLPTMTGLIGTVPDIATMFSLDDQAKVIRLVSKMLDRIDTKLAMSARDRRKLGALLPKAINAANHSKYGNSSRISQITSMIEKVSKLGVKALDNPALKPEVLNMLWIAYAKAETGLNDSHYLISDLPANDRPKLTNGFRASPIFKSGGSITCWQGNGWLYNAPSKRLQRISKMPVHIRDRQAQFRALELARLFDNNLSGTMRFASPVDTGGYPASPIMYPKPQSTVNKLVPDWFGVKQVYPRKPSDYVKRDRYTGKGIDYDHASRLLELPTMAENKRDIDKFAKLRLDTLKRVKLEQILERYRKAGKWQIVTRLKRQLAA